MKSYSFQITVSDEAGLDGVENVLARLTEFAFTVTVAHPEECGGRVETYTGEIVSVDSEALVLRDVETAETTSIDLTLITDVVYC